MNKFIEGLEKEFSFIANDFKEVKRISSSLELKAFKNYRKNSLN